MDYVLDTVITTVCGAHMSMRWCKKWWKDNFIDQLLFCYF